MHIGCVSLVEMNERNDRSLNRLKTAILFAHTNAQHILIRCECYNFQLIFCLICFYLYRGSVQFAWDARCTIYNQYAHARLSDQWSQTMWGPDTQPPIEIYICMLFGLRCACVPTILQLFSLGVRARQQAQILQLEEMNYGCWSDAYKFRSLATWCWTMWSSRGHSTCGHQSIENDLLAVMRGWVSACLPQRV